MLRGLHKQRPVKRINYFEKHRFRLFNKILSMKIYFYPHAYLRDRHLDTIRNWNQPDVVNPELLNKRTGAQIGREKAISGKFSRDWKQFFPLINLKRRPADAPKDSVIYVWGGILLTGRFILDLDNPYALVGYNPSAMPIWRPILRTLLLSSRCLQIRCLSRACQNAVAKLFGNAIRKKITVVYPYIEQQAHDIFQPSSPGPRYLFIGTQFEIKGGPELLQAFYKVKEALPDAHIDIITHLPQKYEKLAHQEGICIHEAVFARNEIWKDFMKNADVLVHPSYMESFGMVVLEGISHGLAIVANDVYAHHEMVIEGINGILLSPPIHYWDGVLAGPLFKNEFRANAYINRVDKTAFVESLAQAMINIGGDRERLLRLRRGSCTLFKERFSFKR